MVENRRTTLTLLGAAVQQVAPLTYYCMKYIIYNHLKSKKP